MTYRLATRKNGTINAGYNGSVEELSVGDLSISTNVFCNFIAELATGKYKSTLQTKHGNEIDVEWDPAKKVVNFDKYAIMRSDFKKFVDYVFNGGIEGWDHRWNNGKPDFVKNAIEYVKSNMGNERPYAYLYRVHKGNFPVNCLLFASE